MFLGLRLEKIKAVLLEKKIVDVATLSEILGVSEVTTRSDLEILEKEGFLKKIHGGAVLSEENPDSPEKNSDIPKYEDKINLAALALQLVEEEDSLFIGPGTTCTLFSKQLKQKPNVRLVTNNLEVAKELHLHVENIFMLGGVIGSKNNDLFTYSPSVDDFFKGIFFNKAFISVDGIHEKAGFTVDNINLVTLYKKIREISGKIIILADYLKFDKIGIHQVGDINFADFITTNEKLDNKYKEFFFRNNIKVLTAYDI